MFAKAVPADRGVLARGRNPLYLLVGVIVAFVASYVAVWTSYPDGSESQELTSSIAATLALAAIAVSQWLAARRCAGEPRTAWAWRWLSMAFTFLAAGYAVYLSYQIRGVPAPYPSVADAVVLCYFPLLLIGLLSFPVRQTFRSNGLRLLLDAVAVVIGAASVIWFFVLGPTVTQAGLSPLSIAISGAYPVGDVLVIFGVACVLVRGAAPGTRAALRLFAVGAGIFVAIDTVAGWGAIHENAAVFSHANAGIAVAAGLFVISAACQRPPNPEQPQESATEDRKEDARPLMLRTWLPYLAPTIVFGLLMGAQFGAPTYLRVGLVVCAALLAALVLLRQFLAQRDLISAQGQLSHMALHDTLTGLPNRALVLDRAEQLLARARRQMEPIAALYLDIDGFKQVNDSFGHAAGDELLKVVAARLTGLSRESDTVGRMGGDELVVLLDSPSLDIAPEIVAERLLEVLREPVTLASAGDRSLTITASIGIAVAVRESADELLRDADMALYQAKSAGKNCIVSFDSSMQTAATDRLLLEMDLRTAVQDDQLVLAYQPTFDLQSETVTGVEALVRWRHPTRGILAPDLFIPIAEESGMIVEIGQWVLEAACRQAATWHGRGQSIGVAVNVSGRQLDDDQELVEHVRDALSNSGLAASALTLEITETVLMRNPDLAAKRLASLKSLGVRIAIDDFGTGYSSMAYLQQFPVDALKIDRSFISGIAANGASLAIIHSLVQLGKTLDLEVFGEGIEEQVQLRNLKREKCDSGQGFLFARPMDPDQIESFIEPATKVDPASV